MSNLGAPYLRLAALVAEYGIEAVVELGCGHGGSMGAVLALPAHGIKPLVYFACDTDPEAVRICKANNPAGIIALDDSLTFLGKLFAQPMPLELRTLFWCDSHFGNHEVQWPLLQELELIAASKPLVENDVILCDDLRCIASPYNPRYRPGELDPFGAQYIRDEYTFAEYTAPFTKTHVVKVWMEDEGVLGFLPRLTRGEQG